MIGSQQQVLQTQFDEMSGKSHQGHLLAGEIIWIGYFMFLFQISKLKIDSFRHFKYKNSLAAGSLRPPIDVTK